MLDFSHIKMRLAGLVPRRVVVGVLFAMAVVTSRMGHSIGLLRVGRPARAGGAELLVELETVRVAEKVRSGLCMISFDNIARLSWIVVFRQTIILFLLLFT